MNKTITETRLHMLAKSVDSLESFIEQVKRFPGWFLTADQKHYTKRDFEVFYTTIRGN